ncbi:MULTISPECIES: hypothetical protein [unclassified Massilia]|uniref:hypothetical protein n=1 Tax=unclassified Massilia TaxID=2609279 RepID=UPI001B817770|nr:MULTISPECIES: hypothetical protein [unclassified Massilia]MBQ5939600.1 hypothetical protein [Massilia sp. AB1]MBQ5963335.1 hypothetical protein [Massilia sp. ZL223]
MKPIHIAASLLVALSLCSAPSFAADPEEHFVLTPALLAKIKAAAPELKKLEKDNDEDDGKNELSVDDYVKAIEAQPRAKAVLSKHGIGTREFALSTLALVHAGLFVGMESMMDKKQAAEMMGKFTREQKANIALLRKLGPSAYTLSR